MRPSTLEQTGTSPPVGAAQAVPRLLQPMTGWTTLWVLIVGSQPFEITSQTITNDGIKHSGASGHRQRLRASLVCGHPLVQQVSTESSRIASEPIFRHISGCHVAHTNPAARKFDTVGGFARTAEEFKVLAEALYGSHDKKSDQWEKPTALLYPTDYWPARDGPSQEVFDAFVLRFEDYLGVKRTEISLEQLWQQNRPSDIDESLAEYFSHVFEWGANPDQWTGLFKDFLPEYEAKFGKPPVLNPQVRFKVYVHLLLPFSSSACTDTIPTVTTSQPSHPSSKLKPYAASRSTRNGSTTMSCQRLRRMGPQAP